MTTDSPAKPSTLRRVTTVLLVLSVVVAAGAYPAAIAVKSMCATDVILLLGPAAEKLGIDLIWFGVILGVNMQTSFMHPPFGFALFYLRSVAPKESYIDRVTGKRMDPVTTGQIYWGAVPFVVIQVIMVLLVILFPSMVMHYKGAASTVDPNTIKIEVPMIEVPPLDFGQPKN